MVYKFTYFINDHLFTDTYTEEGRAVLKFNWLVSKHISFKIITFKPRHNWR